MVRRTAVILVVFALSSLIPACSKIEKPQVPVLELGKLPQGQEYQLLKDATSLPADWGNLVSVTSTPAFPEEELLWFQDSAGNVRMVVYVVRTRKMLDVTLIHRQ